jgi:hypothetical protein
MLVYDHWRITITITRYSSGYIWTVLIIQVAAAIVTIIYWKPMIILILLRHVLLRLRVWRIFDAFLLLLPIVFQLLSQFLEFCR